MEFNRFDICEAYLLFASMYHGGQFSPIYRIFGRLNRMGYKAPLGGVTEDTLTENGRAIYDALVERHELGA